MVGGAVVRWLTVALVGAGGGDGFELEFVGRGAVVVRGGDCVGSEARGVEGASSKSSNMASPC